MGIQDTSRMFLIPPHDPVPWAGTVTYTREAMDGLVSQDRRDNMRWQIADLQGKEEKGKYGMDKDSMK